jgi:hypothetical protein
MKPNVGWSTKSTVVGKAKAISYEDIEYWCCGEARSEAQDSDVRNSVGEKGAKES